jgi:hypothetical protein
VKQRIPAKIVNGKPDITKWNRRNLDNLMKSLEGKDVWICIEKQTKQRSNPQNKYLWGVVYKTVCDHTGDDAESFHHWAKSEFLSTPGEAVPKVKSTKKLNTKEFMEYVEKIIRWAAEFDGIYIPLPNEEELWSVLKDK